MEDMSYLKHRASLLYCSQIHAHAHTHTKTQTQTHKVLKQQKVAARAWDIKCKKETKGQNDFLFVFKEPLHLLLGLKRAIHWVQFQLTPILCFYLTTSPG